MKKQYLDKNNRIIEAKMILRNEDGEMMLVLSCDDDLGVNASNTVHIEQYSARDVYPLSNFGGLSLMDYKYHLGDWEIVGENGSWNCVQCGCWLAQEHEAYPILIYSSDYIGSSLCRVCKEENKLLDNANPHDKVQ